MTTMQQFAFPYWNAKLLNLGCSAYEMSHFKIDSFPTPENEQKPCFQKFGFKTTTSRSYPIPYLIQSQLNKSSEDEELAAKTLKLANLVIPDYYSKSAI